jgi:hypothetical protein
VPKEMIFLVEQEDTKKFKAINLIFNIKVFADSYEEIKKNAHNEVVKLNLITNPETIRFRFVREEVDSFL